VNGIWGEIISWALYFPHQIAQWVILYKAMQEKPKYQEEWRWFNWWMLYVNMFFIPIKLLTNYFTYNALSAHLPLWFGQGTVFNIVLIVMAMQVPVRGMCCGTCKRGVGCGKKGPACCEKSDGGLWTEMA